MDRPVIFSAPMVRALIEGRKSQTRRLLKPPKEILRSDDPTHYSVSGYGFRDSTNDLYADFVHWPRDRAEVIHKRLPYQVGDRLWVREACHIDQTLVWDSDGHGEDLSEITYRADFPTAPFSWRPSIHMPRWASRLTLVVEAVKVERLNGISRDDAIAEGIVQTWGDWAGDVPQCFIDESERYGDASGPHIYDNHSSVENFRVLWNSLHGSDRWGSQEVVALTFRCIQANIDTIKEAA